MNNPNFFEIALPKWPAMTVIGKKVTKDQAAEIIIRCSSLHYSSNDTSFDEQINNILGIKTEGWRVNYDSLQEVQEKFKILPVEYLDLNDRVVSCYVGWPHGLMDWDG